MTFYLQVSRGWTFRFCKKYHKLLLKLPNPSTPLFSAMELQVCNYRKLVQDTLATYGTTKVSVVAMDEVPLQLLPKGIINIINTDLYKYHVQYLYF